MLRLVLLGGPGSGKGTQAELLARRTGVRHISTGELLRAEVAAGSELGGQVVGHLDSGELVPDELLLDLTLPLVRAAAGSGAGYVLDGFPRSVNQARLLDAGTEPAAAVCRVVLLEVPRDELVARLRNRAAEQNRADDADAVIVRRLCVFETEAGPLVDYYLESGRLVVLDAAAPPEVVAERLEQAL